MYALVALELQKDGTYIVGGKMATGCTEVQCKNNFMLQGDCDPADFAQAARNYADMGMPLLLVKL